MNVYVEIYDPVTKRFEEIGHLDRKAEHTATLLRDGKVLIAGGNPMLSGVSENSSGIITLYEDPTIILHTLTAKSSNPNSGVQIQTGKIDVFGDASGMTKFTRVFNQGTTVTLTAPLTMDGGTFSSWLGCTSVSGANLSTCTVTMNRDRSVTAGYIADPKITVTAPNTSVAWRAGTPHVIKWRHVGDVGSSVKIVLLKGGVVDRTIGSAPVGPVGGGSYIWTIPSGLPAANNYKIRIRSISNGLIRDESDTPFVITNAVP